MFCFLTIQNNNKDLHYMYSKVYTVCNNGTGGHKKSKLASSNATDLLL